mgnify:CR=1 FL=1
MNLKVIDINKGLVKIEWPDGRSGWWNEGSFKPHEYVSMKFKMGDRVDFIDPKVIQGHSTTNLEVVGFNMDRRAVNIKWPDGMSAWWSESYLKLHEPYKVGDLVDIISPNAKVWHGEFSKNLPICDITSGGTIVVRGVNSKLVGWHKNEVQASQGVGFKVGDLVDTSSGDKNLYVTDINDNNTVKVRYPNGSYGQLHISQCVLSQVVNKVRVFHYPRTNVMYYVMLDGNVFAQTPLFKSDFTLDSLLKLDVIVEVTQ